MCLGPKMLQMCKNQIISRAFLAAICSCTAETTELATIYMYSECINCTTTPVTMRLIPTHLTQELVVLIIFSK